MLDDKIVEPLVFKRIVGKLNEMSGKVEDDDIVIRRFLGVNQILHATEDGVNEFLAEEAIDDFFSRLEHIVCNSDECEDDVNEFIENCIMKYFVQPSQTMHTNLFYMSMFDVFFDKFFIINGDDCMKSKNGEYGWYVIKKDNLTIDLEDFYDNANDELDCHAIVKKFKKLYKKCQNNK